jgi:hypothetical protein
MNGLLLSLFVLLLHAVDGRFELAEERVRERRVGERARFSPPLRRRAPLGRLSAGVRTGRGRRRFAEETAAAPDDERENDGDDEGDVPGGCRRKNKMPIVRRRR